MYVTSLEMSNFRCFKSMGPIRLDKINVLIGENNSGKSTLLRALHLLQEGNGLSKSEVRVGTKNAEIKIGLGDISGIEFWGKEAGNIGEGLISKKLVIDSNNNFSILSSLQENPTKEYGVANFQNIAPNHFIIPFLSKRKATAYNPDVRSAHASAIVNDLQFLAAKLASISNPGFPKHHQYREACEGILGFLVTSVVSEGGQLPGIFLPNNQSIFIDQMGEGVPNIVALLADLVISENKLFLIEEPENDLHPRALKALLDLIIESSKSNQFVVSTHSNIVVRHLASSRNCNLFNITTEPIHQPPEASIKKVEQTVEARLSVLRDLGYEFSDFDLWDGWLILEEASAERIIRDYLIPWFAPRLSRIRTLSTRGADQIQPTFEDFNRLVRFTHLEESYRNAAWVRVDGDKKGIEIVNKLKVDYPTWKSDRFSSFNKPQFEHYYPIEFQEKVRCTFEIQDKKERTQAKKLLSAEVRNWLDADEKRGREALEISAAEIISDLKKIEQQLKI